VLLYQLFQFEPLSMGDDDEEDEVELVDEVLIEEPVKKPATRKSSTARKTAKK